MTNIEFSQLLQEKIKERGYTLKQLAEATGVSPAHLENLSHGRFEKLPPAPYLHGYLEKIGQALGFDPEPWWQEMKRHEDLRQSGQKDRLPDSLFFKKPERSWIFGAGIVVLVIFYAGFRFSAILGRPLLTVYDPSDATTETGVERFAVRGVVQNGDVYINNEAVTPQKDGSWEKEVLLESGLNTIEIRAKKLLGRENVVVRQIIFSPPVENLTPESASSQ